MVYTDEQRETLEQWWRLYMDVRPLLEVRSVAFDLSREMVPLIVKLGVLGLETEMNTAIVVAWRLSPTDPYVLLWYGLYLMRRGDPTGERLLENIARSAEVEGMTEQGCEVLRSMAKKWLNVSRQGEAEPKWLGVVMAEMIKLKILV